jgi:superfamily II DNA or RNA helicase
MRLRKYQLEAVSATLTAWDDGIRTPAVVLPTGAGKTVCFAALVRILVARGERPAILVNRDELVRQTVDKILKSDPNLLVGVIQGKRDEHDESCDVVVASIQTLSRQARLDRIKPDRFTRLIADECHYSAAPSWRRVMDYFGCPAVGFTATMTRADKKGLGEVWETVVYEQDLRWAIEQGFLVQPAGVTVKLADLDLTKVKTSNGDFSEGDLGRAMSQAHAGPIIAKAYLEHARDEFGEIRRGIVFTPTIDTAQTWLQDFVDAGIPTELVIGETPTTERQAKYAATAAGTNKVLMSVGVLTTGFDLPAVEVAVIARPTKSKGLYRQMCGRVLRLSPETGKTSALILDVVGATRLGLANVVDLKLDKPVIDGVVMLDELPSGGAALEREIPKVPEGVKFLGFDPITGEPRLDLEYGLKQKIARSAKQKMWDVEPVTRTPYLPPDQDAYPYWTILHRAQDGSWSVLRRHTRLGATEVISEGLTFAQATWQAMQGYQGTTTLLRGEASEGQVRFLQNLRQPVVEGLTKAEASKLINRFLLRKLLK